MKVFIATIFALSVPLGASAWSCEDDCDNNYACGVCLMEVSRRNGWRRCPLSETEMRKLKSCARRNARSLYDFEYCNADDYQCGTVWAFEGGDRRPCGYREIYRKEPCDDDDDREPARRPKPSNRQRQKPSNRQKKCKDFCDNDYKCQICLKEVKDKQCNKLDRLKPCGRRNPTRFRGKEYCEGRRGRCGTDDRACYELVDCRD